MQCVCAVGNPGRWQHGPVGRGQRTAWQTACSLGVGRQSSSAALVERCYRTTRQGPARSLDVVIGVKQRLTPSWIVADNPTPFGLSHDTLFLLDRAGCPLLMLGTDWPFLTSRAAQFILMGPQANSCSCSWLVPLDAVAGWSLFLLCLLPGVGVEWIPVALWPFLYWLLAVWPALPLAS